MIDFFFVPRVEKQCRTTEVSGHNVMPKAVEQKENLQPGMFIYDFS